MHCRMILLVAIWAVAVPVFGQGTSAPAKARGTEDKLARESDVQTRVSDEIAHLVREFGELVDDVESNQVFKQADGGTLAGMKNSLVSTDKNRVRVAASELRKAVEYDKSRGLHVKEAAVQVSHANAELTDLLRQANGLMLEDTILQAIQEIIRDQEGVARGTAQAGREQLQQKPLSADPVQLTQEQRQIVKRVKRLKEALQQAQQEELTVKVRERLQQARKIADEKLLEQKAQKAVDDLDKVDMMEAFQEQQQVIAILAEMADAISDVERPTSDAAIEALKTLLEAQKGLREKTQSLSAEDFKNTAEQLQLEQLNLSKELPQNSKAAEQAAAAMAEAANALEKMDQKAAVAEMMEAEAALGKAIEEGVGPGPGVPGAKGDAGTDDKGDGDSDKDEEGRGNDGKGKKGKGKKPGPPKPDSEPGDQQPKEDTEPDENASVEPMLAKNTPTRTKVEPKAGERLFEKTKVEGKIPQGSESTWTSLSQKERNSLSENFARELPREYRDMLKVYFEELSK